jgi:hypothetical protein
MWLRRGLLAGAALAMAACAATGVSEQRVARLPQDERAQIVTAQQSIAVAKQNLASAQLSRDQARQFRKVARDEVAAARSRLQAAHGSIDLSRQTRDHAGLRDAQHNEDVARTQLVIARAKADYADRLIELREARVDAADAEVAATRADVELQKANLLVRNDVDPGVDVRRLETARQDAQERLADRRARVATVQGEVEQLKVAWDDRRGEARTASRGETLELGAPVAPAPLPMPPRGDVNDTPGAPELPASQQAPPNNIAPAP